MMKSIKESYKVIKRKIEKNIKGFRETYLILKTASFLLLLNLLGCTTYQKIPLEKQGGCDYNPKDSTFSEWSFGLEKFPKFLNDSTEKKFVLKNQRFSELMTKHEINYFVIVRSFLKNNGKMTNLKIYKEDGNFDCFECDTNKINKIRKDCRKEAFRLIKKMKYTPAILKNKTVILEMLTKLDLDFKEYVRTKK